MRRIEATLSSRTYWLCLATWTALVFGTATGLAVLVFQPSPSPSVKASPSDEFVMVEAAYWAETMQRVGAQ